MIDKFSFKSYCVIGLFLMTSCVNTVEKMDNAKYVDPFICTGSDHGQTDPAAGIPYGMVKLCPDTYPIAHSGYDYDAKEILGFSHNRFSGVGCKGTGGNIRVLPFLNKDNRPEKLSYDKKSEQAVPGFYSTILDDNIKVELTATNRVGFHKYTFLNSGKAGITIDLNSSFEKIVSNNHSITKEGIIIGNVSSETVCNEGKYKMYFALKTDAVKPKMNDSDSTLSFSFDVIKNEEVKVWCALSVVDEAHALDRLQEVSSLTFENVKAKAYQSWNDIMNVVSVETDNDALRRNFYTHIYHVSQSPFYVSEDDGKYRGSDGVEYQNKKLNYYHGWSIWDTFRSKMPLLSLIYPDIYKDLMSSIAEMYKQGKPDWATENEPYITVRTEHSVIVLLDAHRKGLLNFSLEEIYEELKEEATRLPFKSPDNVLESSYDLWALSEIAKDLGYEKDHKQYLAQAMNYKKIWKEKFMLMDENSDIMHGDGLYEGTLWQYRWLVPFDIAGIQKLMGGKEIFEKDLDYFFENELFNIGNQPDIQVPYLYAYTNSPWKTDLLVSKLISEETNNWYGTHRKWKTPSTRKIFTDTPDGYISQMDDDAGTMSAWYVWSSLGLYPVFPGDTNLVITIPQFNKSTIKFGDRMLEIEKYSPNPTAKYIQKIEFNNKVIDSRFIDSNRLMQGGKLRITLGENPA